MTPEQLEALRKGASMEEVLAMAGPGDDAALQAAAEAAAAAKAANVKAVTTPVTAPTIEALQAQVAELTTAAAAFTGEIEAKTQALTAAEARVTELEAAATASAAAQTALVAALSPYVQKMSVALSKPVDPKGMSAVALAEAHASLASDFAKAYPAGRQSQTTAKAEDKKKTDVAVEIETAQALKLNF